MTFGTRIKELRSLKKITQNELAQSIGVARTTVAGYEQDKQQPSFEILNKIAKYFNVSTDYLLGHTANKTNPRIDTIAAHLDSDKFTDEDLEDIQNFIQFVESKKKKQ